MLCCWGGLTDLLHPALKGIGSVHPSLKGIGSVHPSLKGIWSHPSLKGIKSVHPALKGSRLSTHSVNITQPDSHTKAKSVN